ncbi:hypothetical protein Ccrd_025606 [Cynara cardunculus var. scolymus]|uniref:Uncharacterized protein n=1 Tax=Cynara cardunculus var. scolymus TaxID=59895 RepID=A0A103WB35_CYNCS|nr:hypothetical protein Ccrd_025606 [Cynara cardunculus var. scolymus]
MASKPSLTPIADLTIHKIPTFLRQFLQTNPAFCSSSTSSQFPRKLLGSKLVSRRKASVCSNSLKQETVQNHTATQTPLTSSNKLVLVIGGTGGVVTLRLKEYSPHVSEIDTALMFCCNTTSVINNTTIRGEIEFFLRNFGKLTRKSSHEELDS